MKYIVSDYDGQLNDENNRKEFEKDRSEYVNEGMRLLEFLKSKKIEITCENEYVDLRMDEEKIEEKYWM